MRRLFFALLLCLPLSATAADDVLLAALNAWRGRGAVCEGVNVAAAPPLTMNPGLARVAAALAGHTGADLNATLARAGYLSRRSFVLSIDGPGEADELARYAEHSFCAQLRSPEVSQIGIDQRQTGNGVATTLVLATPQALPHAGKQDQERAAQRLLELTNQARAVPRACGKRRFAAAVALTWAPRLAAASLAYANDLAQNHYLSHVGRDGSQPSTRVRRAGYDWKAVGENLAAGQATPEEAVAAWLTSPGHCSNLMNPAYREMGAGYALSAGDNFNVYWVQLFGTPR